MSMAAGLEDRGAVTGKIKDEIIGMGNIFWTAYHSAVDALAAYRRTMDAEAKDRLNAALVQASKAAGEILAYVQPLVLEKGGITQ